MIKRFGWIPAGVLALCTIGFCANPVDVPRHEGANTAASGGAVTLHFAGAQRIMQDGRGGLEIVRADGTLRHYRPELFQTVEGKRREVPFTYHVISSDRVELKAGHFDASVPLEVAPASRGRTSS